MDETELVFRQGTADDIDAVLCMIHGAENKMDAQGIRQWDGVYPDRATFEEDVRNESLYLGLLGDTLAVCYVINDICDEQYQNGAWEFPDTRYRVGHRLCVNTALQGKGLASRTMEHIEEQLRAEGVESFRFDAFSQNPVALSLYEKHGYKRVGTAHWRKGMFYLMEKRL